MNTRKNPSALILIIFLIFYSSTFAAGRLSGSVKDNATQDQLPGANIVIDGTALGATTTIDGEFFISNIPAGNYTLEISYIGYESKRLDIVIKDSEDTVVNIELNSVAIQGEMIVVSAQREGQIGAINKQLNSDAIVNVVSSEKILEVPDANAAESVARLPGVSIKREGGEGSQVVIRGLSPKYSRVTIDGIDMASTSDMSSSTDNEETRSTNLSAISQENIKGIELYKAPTADMDGDAIGGTVNFQTAKAGINREIITRMYGSYNSLEDDYGQYDLFAKYSERYFDTKLGIQFSANIEKRNRSTDKYSGSYEVKWASYDSLTDTYPLWVTGATVEDVLETRRRAGGSLILDYELDNGNIWLTNFYSKTDRRIYNRLINLSPPNGGRLAITDTERNLEQVMNILSGEHHFWGFHIDWRLANSSSLSKIPLSHEIDFTHGSVTTIPNSNILTRDTSAIGYFDAIPNKENINLFLDTSEPTKDKVKEDNIIAGLDLSYDFILSDDIAGMLKFGGKYKQLERSRARSKGRLWGYLAEPWSVMSTSTFRDNSYKPHKFLDGKVDFKPVLDIDENKKFYRTYKDCTEYVINDAWENNDDYNIKENIYAGYLLTKLNYKQTVTFIPGIRYEAVDNIYNAFSFIQNYTGSPPDPREGSDFYKFPEKATVVYHDWLPMIHLKIKPLDWFDTRLSYTKTISRPDYNDIMPFQDLNTAPEQSAARGNPDLKPARADNYDLYLSFYDSFWGLFTVGYFYKAIDGVNAHYRTYLDDAKLDSLGLRNLNYQYNINHELYRLHTLNMPVNLEESTVKGVEFEIQTNLTPWPVPDFLKGIVLGFNYSIIQSKTYFPVLRVETEVLPGFPPRQVKTYTEIKRSIPVPGQADRLTNFTIGYDIAGLSARLSMFHQSESLSNPGDRKEQDTYSNSFTRWDLSVKQFITEHIDAYFNVVNLTKADEGVYEYRKNRPTSLSSFGTTMDLGIQVKF